MFALSSFVAFALVAGDAVKPPEVTVYNQGFAFVKEVRPFKIKIGRQTLVVEDVATGIETNSVGIKSLTSANAFEVLEQNYRYDLINTQAILDKSVGQTIRLRRILPNGAKEVVEGTLMNAPTSISMGQFGDSWRTYNGMVLKTADGRILLDPKGEIEVTRIPEGMISKPSLVWDVNAYEEGLNQVELSYITQGMTWNADYVLTLDGQGTADLKGWVTMTNNSGTTYKNAVLKLLAGDVNRVQNRRQGVDFMAKAMRDKAEEVSDFKEESLFEYHLYTLQRPATLKDKEIKQLSLLDGNGIKYTKKLIVDSMRDFGMYYPGEGEVGTGNLKPQVRVEFYNKKENHLGMPLPKGNFKVYQRDKSGSVQMLGEDQIDHTPRDEKVSLVIGRSFDVVAERKRLSYSRTGPRDFREVFEIEVRNRKAEAETVNVLERHYGDWKVAKTNVPFKKLDSLTMEYVLTLKPGEVQKIVYTIDTSW